MSNRPLFGPERKPWEDPADDRLAPSAYAAQATFGIVELAVEWLHEHSYDVAPADVGTVSQVFARVLIQAQLEVGEGGGWNSMLNVRLRGALRTALRVTPLDESDQDTPKRSWAAWEAELKRVTLAIAHTAAWLYARTPQQIMEAGR